MRSITELIERLPTSEREPFRAACRVIASLRDGYDDFKGQPPRDLDSYTWISGLTPGAISWMRDHLDLEGVVTGPQLQQRGFPIDVLGVLGLADPTGGVREFPDEPLRTATIETSVGLLVCLLWRRLYVNAHDPNAGVFKSLFRRSDGAIDG